MIAVVVVFGVVYIMVSSSHTKKVLEPLEDPKILKDETIFVRETTCSLAETHHQTKKTDNAQTSESTHQ